MNRQSHGSSSGSSIWGGSAIPLVLLGVVLGIILLGLARMGAYDRGTWTAEDADALTSNPVSSSIGGISAGRLAALRAEARRQQVARIEAQIAQLQAAGGSQTEIASLQAQLSNLAVGGIRNNVGRQVAATADPRTTVIKGAGSDFVPTSGGALQKITLPETVDDDGLGGDTTGIAIFHPIVPNPAPDLDSNRIVDGSINISATLLKAEYANNTSQVVGTGRFGTRFVGELEDDESVGVVIIRGDASGPNLDQALVEKGPSGEDIGLDLNPETNPNVVLFIDSADGVPQKKDVDLFNEKCGQKFTMVEVFLLNIENAQDAAGRELIGFSGNKYIQVNGIRTRTVLCTSSGSSTNVPIVIQPAAPVVQAPIRAAAPVVPVVAPAAPANSTVRAALPSIQKSGTGFREIDLGGVRAVSRVNLETTGSATGYYVFAGDTSDNMRMVAAVFGSFPLGRNIDFSPSADARYIRIVMMDSVKSATAQITNVRVF